MSEERERLFRDHAALERVAELEDDNRRLREEVDRLRNGGAEPTPSRPRSGAPFLVAVASTAMLSLLVASSAMRGHRCHSRAHPSPAMDDGPRHAVTLGAPRAISLGRSVAKPPADCSPPYTTEANGIHRYKIHCLQ